MNTTLPPSFAAIVGPLPAPGRLDDSLPYPFETITPVHEARIDRDGVPIWHAVFGEAGPWLAFAPPFQVVHSALLKACVPWLAQHFRVVVQDGRGNGRSGRPACADAYSFDHFFADFVAVLDAVGADRVAVVGVSASALTVLRLAAEQPARVSHLVIAGGFADSMPKDTAALAAWQVAGQKLEDDWPAWLEAFVRTIFNEPHSTKPFEDGVRYGWASSGETIGHCRRGWAGQDVRALAQRIGCPTLVIHGDADARVPYARGVAIAEMVPGARLLTIGGGGHLPMARDPVVFNRAVRDFVAGAPRTSTWFRAIARPRRALFVSSAIGLGHVQRDLAIARELRKLQPDLAIDWFTVDPAARYLTLEGERVHPITARLANESRHFEGVAGEHDLNAFFALRTMDEVMVRNFMVLTDLLEAEHYDLVIGDEAWEVDRYYHENPELKRQPFVFLTDFVGCLPMSDDPREANLCADRNADEIEHIARFPYVRDASIFVGNSGDVTPAPFGPGLPRIRDWCDRNFEYTGYALPFDPAAYADTARLRARLGYGADERIVVAAVGGTGVGGALLDKIAQSFVHMKREEPGLRMLLVAGPRLAPEAFPRLPGLEVRPYVHKLFEHLACCDLALVQGGLSTCMELVATRRRFLSFPLQHHFEQCVHVRHRLANYGADRSVDYAGLEPQALARRALEALHAPVDFQPVETDGAARAARRVADVLENRAWVRR